VNSADDFVESLPHRYPRRPSTPVVIDQIILCEFLTRFNVDRCSSIDSNRILDEPLVENPLWHTAFDQPPLLKTSALLPCIILSCGLVLIQHKEPCCISFTCRHNDTMLAIYSMLSISLPSRDPIEQFVGGKQGVHERLWCFIFLHRVPYLFENDVQSIHQILLNNRN